MTAVPSEMVICNTVCEAEPEFKRIITDLDVLVARLVQAKNSTVRISDLLIGVEYATEDCDYGAKPSPPEFFTIKCFDLIDSLRTEVDCIIQINDRLLRHIQEVE